MKLLLVTDTHGKLSRLNALAADAGCEVILHAGDFGFYDDGSLDRLTERELLLRIVHSGLTDAEKKEVLTLALAERRSFARQHLPLSDMPRFLSGEERFEIPVYAVWGNHEDLEVVQRLRSGEYRIENLNLLHEEASFHLSGVHVFGLGGNFLVGRSSSSNPWRGVEGGSGASWSSTPGCWTRSEAMPHRTSGACWSAT